MPRIVLPSRVSSTVEPNIELASHSVSKFAVVDRDRCHAGDRAVVAELGDVEARIVVGRRREEDLRPGRRLRLERAQHRGELEGLTVRQRQRRPATAGRRRRHRLVGGARWRHRPRLVDHTRRLQCRLTRRARSPQPHRSMPRRRSHRRFHRQRPRRAAERGPEARVSAPMSPMVAHSANPLERPSDVGRGEWAAAVRFPDPARLRLPGGLRARPHQRCARSRGRSASLRRLGRRRERTSRAGNRRPRGFGASLVSVHGRVHSAGDSDRPFTIQSVSKPFVYALAISELGLDEVHRHVGFEPSGEPFNAISLEPDTGRPDNPLINAGAIVTSALIDGPSVEARFERVRSFLSECAGRELAVDLDVFESETTTGDRNRALAHLARSSGVLRRSVDDATEVYFRQCSIVVTTEDLAVMGATLANGGVNPVTKRRVMDERAATLTLSVMATCGMYDHSGEWMARVGLPAKSGVGGGIVAVQPAAVRHRSVQPTSRLVGQQRARIGPAPDVVGGLRPAPVRPSRRTSFSRRLVDERRRVHHRGPARRDRPDLRGDGDRPVAVERRAPEVAGSRSTSPG